MEKTTIAEWTIEVEAMKVRKSDKLHMGKAWEAFRGYMRKGIKRWNKQRRVWEKGTDSKDPKYE